MLLYSTRTLRPTVILLSLAASAPAATQTWGAGGTIQIANGSTTTLNYTGAAASTDRLLQVAGSGTATISNNGGGAINFTNTGAAITGTVADRTLKLAGAYSGAANTFAGQLLDLGTALNITALKKDDAGAWRVTGTSNSYSGAARNRMSSIAASLRPRNRRLRFSSVSAPAACWRSGGGIGA